jgi:alpha-tubulin suppressor-like RCC1 family protein
MQMRSDGQGTKGRRRAAARNGSGFARRLPALALLAIAVIAFPGPAAADQASQPASPVAGHIGTGNFHSCAVVAGAARCWGYGGDGQLGLGDLKSIGDDEDPVSAGPIDFGAGRTVNAIATGSVHTCALLDDGSVRCWGFGGDGRLGYGNQDTIGDNEPAAAGGPVDLGAGRTAKAIAAGNGHTCALLDDGSVRCWGFNLDGRLGYGHTDAIGDTELPGSAGPVNFGAGRTAKAITAGGFHTCALLDDDTVKCWGFGGNGRLGYAQVDANGRIPDVGRTPETTPNTVPPVDLGPGPRTAKAITAGFGHTCAILDDDTVRCWGFGGLGRLGYGNSLAIGDNEHPGSVAPVDLGTGRTARAIHAGFEHTCAVLDDNTVRCWGGSGFGKLGLGDGRSIGDNETPGSVGPVALGPGRTATAISAGERHTCARLDDGSVRCWGSGANGRLGYCREATIGDDETPDSVGPVPLGQVGIPGDGCPRAPVVIEDPPAAPAPVPAAAVPAASLPAAPLPLAPDPLAAALAAQDVRAAALRACLTEAARGVDAERRRARRLSRARRTSALRAVDRRARRLRSECAQRHGRTPATVTGLTARATGNGRARLAFRAVGTDGVNPPAARSYVIKQSRAPIRSARAFARAASLCRGTCSFNVTAVGAPLELTVTELRRRVTYHYAIAAVDNVSGRVGPRSATIKVRVR